jgi:hypothetical protein
MGIPLPSLKKLEMLLVEIFVQPFKISLPQERFSGKLITLSLPLFQNQQIQARLQITDPFPAVMSLTKLFSRF